MDQLRTYLPPLFVLAGVLLLLCVPFNGNVLSTAGVIHHDKNRGGALPSSQLCGASTLASFDARDRTTRDGTGASAASPVSDVPAVNYLDPDGGYFHAAIFSCMPPSSEAVQSDARVVTEFTGLLVPRAYDCSNLDESGGSLAGFNYFSAVPSRWFPCRELESLLQSNVRRFTPSLPLIDEEYAETAAVYEAALGAKGTLNAAELGARWGTWGFRATAAARRFNPRVHEANLFFAEASKEGCTAIQKVADLNGFAPAVAGSRGGSNSDRAFSVKIDVECGFATPAALIAWASKVRGDIDLVDVDIQGGEATFFTPAVVAMLNARARRLVIGTHEVGLDEQMVALFPSWILRERLPYGAGTPAARNCREALRQADKRASTAIIDSLECRATGHELGPFGPVLQWDGELILDNKKFLDR